MRDTLFFMDPLDGQLPLIYEELRKLARGYLSRERPDHTLQPTALVHEAYLRLREQHAVDFTNRAQFLGIAAQMMRRILVNHAEARNAAKRDSSMLLLHEPQGLSENDAIEVLALDLALQKLESVDQQQMKVVELRCFAGLSIEETADLLGISIATVKREWASARLWIRRELAGIHNSRSSTETR